MAPPTITQHLKIIVSVGELIAKLDALALDDWEMINLFPMVTNIRELGEDGKVVCILRRKVKP